MKSKRLLLLLLIALFAPWAVNAQETLTVYDGDATNGNIPIYGFYVDAYNKAEMIMSSDDLSAMTGATINKMTWYLSTPASDSWGAAHFQVYLKEVTEASFSTSFIGIDDATLVWEGSIDGTGNTIELEFTEGYTYDGGNLFIAVYQSEKGSYKSAAFAGEEVTAASISNYSYTSLEAITATSSNVKNFLPKTTFEYTPSGGMVYFKPKNLAVSDITANGATLTWEAGNDETSWNVQYKKASEEEWTSAGAVNQMTITFNTFESGTVYNVQVQSDYGSGNLSNWTSASFATLACNPEDMGEIAYTLTDTYGDGWNGCKLQIFLTGTDVMITELTISNGNLVEGTLPLCYDVDYDLVWVAGSYAYETGFVLTGPEGETIYEFHGTGSSSGGSPTAGVLTTFRIHLATCSRPSEVVASNITYNSATITWTPGAEDQDQWQVAYGVGVVNPDSEGVTIETTNEPTITLSLVENTTYSVYVRSVCSESDMSSWSNLCTFATPLQFPMPTVPTISDITAISAKANWQGDATAFNLRYRVKGGNPNLFFESFEADFTGDGWGVVDNDADDNTWGTMPIANYNMDGVPLFAANGESCIASSSLDDEYNYIEADNWIYTPQMDLTGTLEFYVADLGEEYMETFSVYVAIGEPNSIEDFTALAEGLTTPGVVPSSPDAWAKHTFDLSAYDGQQGCIAIRHQGSGESGYYLFVDAITVKDNTIIPTGEWVTMENVTSPTRMEGLTPVTTYEAQVQAVYADGVSNWTDMVEFTTLRADAMITNFEVTNIKTTTATVNVEGSQATYNIRYRKAAGGFFEDFEGIAANGDPAPDGWTTIDADGDGNNWFAWFPSQVGVSETDNNGNPTVRGHVCMTSASYASVALTPDNWLISPQVELGGTLSLWYRGQDPSWASEVFAVYVSTAGNTNTTDFVELVPDVTCGGLYQELTADLSAYEGQMGYVAIRHYNVTDMFRLNIDDFAIIKEGEEAGEWVTVEGVTVPYTITGLDPNTKYEVQVQGVIDDETTTEWTNIISFYTKPVVSQTIALAEGWNWVSFNVEIAMADLQAALLEAYPSAGMNELVVKAKYVGGGGQTAYNPTAHRWIGSLTTLDLSLMYMVKVPAAGEITVEGSAIDPADYPLTIAPGANWIAFPMSESMSITDAFAGFPSNGDIVKTKGGGQAQWNSGANRWIGGLANVPLQPGQGYIYNSKATETRTYTYPTVANVVPSKANNNTGFVASQKLKPEPLDMKLAPQAPHRSLKDIINK